MIRRHVPLSVGQAEISPELAKLSGGGCCARVCRLVAWRCSPAAIYQPIPASMLRCGRC